jgi:hypothetical protein
VLVDIFLLLRKLNLAKKAKRPSAGFVLPADGLFGFYSPKPSGGAGYGDRNNNGQKVRKLTKGKYSGLSHARLGGDDPGFPFLIDH